MSGGEGAKPKNLAIERFRGIGAVMVVLIHAPPLLHSSLPALQRSGWVVRELCQVAVPFFFLLSGYLMGTKWKSGRADWSDFSRSMARLAALYVPWFFLFLALDISQEMPHSPQIVLRRLLGFAVDGAKTTGYHLWFLPSLALAQIACWSSHRFAKSVMPALAVGAGLFLLFYVREFLRLDAPLAMIATEGMNLSLVCVALGVALGLRESFLRVGPGVVLACLGGLLLEGAILQWQAPGEDPVHAFQFFRILSAVAVLLWGLADPQAPRLPGRAVLDFLGRHSTAIYVSHLGFLTLIPFEAIVPNGFLRDNLVRWTIAVCGGACLSMLIGRSRIPALRGLVR